MLTEAKNNLRIMLLSIKYNLIRCMENRISFFTSIIFMILNNASFIIQWITIFSIKESIGNYTLNDVMLFWSISSGAFGLTHVLFNGAAKISKYIEYGKLDSYLVLPKNVLCSIITSSLEPSAIGDLLYGYIALIIFNFSIKNIIIYTILIIFGSLIYTSFLIIYQTLSFKFTRSHFLVESFRDIFLNLSLYPDIIFPKLIKIIAFTIIPSGFASWIPVHILLDFSIIKLLILIIATIIFISLAFFTFNLGLKKYTSSNLMGVKGD